MYKPMVQVHLWSALRSLADGQEVVEVRASTIGQMLNALIEAHPALETPIEAGVSVSIDGAIYNQNRDQPVDEGQEIYLLQRIRGG